MIGRAFIEAIVVDLRAFAAPLLESGLAPRRAGVREGGGASLSLLHESVERLCGALPRLLDEAANDNRLSRRFTHRAAPIPRRARASRAPWDHQWHEGRLLPSHWVTVDPLPVPDPDAVGYLRFLVESLGEQLDRAEQRLGKHLEDARSARSDASIWARDEKEQIVAMEARIRGSHAALARAGRRLRTLGGPPVGARAREPRPYPLTRTWRALRDLAARILDPSLGLPQWLGAMLVPGLPSPELSFLYQRWCGVQVLRSLERAGFRLRSDPIGALFLGGLPVELSDDRRNEITLWCEPRFIPGETHPSGLAPARGEQSPDYVLTCRGERGIDASILDATLSTDDDRLEKKGEYRSSLHFEARRLVAGVPTTAHPRRSWAIAPIDQDRCRLGDPEGRRGVVPCLPNRDRSGLDAWIGDVVRGARAWGVKKN